MQPMTHGMYRSEPQEAHGFIPEMRLLQLYDSYNEK